MSDISKIDMERINGLLDKLNEVTNKINSMKYVIETGSNNNGWYRKWSDGFIEQWGILNKTTSAGSELRGTITLPTSFSSTNYIIQITSYRIDINPYNPCYFGAYQITSKNSFIYRCQGINNSQYIDGISWYACGY